MTDKKMLLEFNEFKYDAEVVQERSLATGRMKDVLYLKGIIQRAETLNQNGRVYPRSILEREVKNYQKLIKEKRAYGALDHTDNSIIELQTVSHVMTEVTMDADGVVYGKLRILPTDPHGKNVLTLVEAGTTIGISSRGLGTVRPDSQGRQVVQDDFQLVCFDLVSEPSTPGAWMMKENFERSVSREDIRKINKFLNGGMVSSTLDEILSWGNK